MAAESCFMGDFDDSGDDFDDTGGDFDDENEIDEDIEAILYSQIHFGSSDIADAAFGNYSFLATQQSAADHVHYNISVTPVQALKSDSNTSMDVGIGSTKSDGISQPNPVKTRILVVPVTRPSLGAGSLKSAAACSTIVVHHNKAKQNKADGPYKKDGCRDASQEMTGIISPKMDAESSNAPAASVTLFLEQSKSNVSRSKRPGSDIADTCEPSSTKKMKTKSSLQQKFDMELELGIKKPQLNSKLHPVTSGPDTLSLPGNTTSHKPTRNLKQFSSCPKFSSSGSERPSGYRRGLQESAPISLQQLSEIVSRSHKQSGKKEVVMISSDSEIDDTSSSDSDSNVRSSSGLLGEKDLVQASSDSDSSTDDSYSVCSTSTDSSESEHESKDEVDSSSHDDTSNSDSDSKSLDLNWNVDATDRQMIQNYQEESSKRGDTKGSKWQINDMDQFRGQGSRPGSRYHTKIDVRCHNCDKRGHLSKVCPEPKKQPACGLCGEPGHVLQRCPGRLCYNCNFPGHTGKDCPSPRRNRNIKCRRCWMLGHMAFDCPDLWRQYHMTVPSSGSEASNSTGLVIKETIKNSRVYCCNCARKGHLAFECTRQRMDNYSQPTYPFIAEYDGTIASKSRSRKEERDSSVKGHQRWHSSDSRSGGDGSQRSWSNSKGASGSVDTSGKPDANWNLHRNLPFPELDRFRQSPDPVKKAKQVSSYVRGFLGQNISGDTPGRNSFQSKHAGASHSPTLKRSGGEDEFKTPTTPSKSKQRKESQWHGGMSSRNEGQKKDRWCEDSTQKVVLQKNKNKRGYQERDFSVNQVDSTNHNRKKNNWRNNSKLKNVTGQNLFNPEASSIPAHGKQGTGQQKGSPGQSQGSRRVSEQVVQSSMGFKTSVKNLVIHRTFQNSQN